MQWIMYKKILIKRTLTKMINKTNQSWIHWEITHIYLIIRKTKDKIQTKTWKKTQADKIWTLKDHQTDNKNLKSKMLKHTNYWMGK